MSQETATSDALPSPAQPYEFGAAENSTIRALATRTRIWGAVSLVGGLVCLVFAVHAALSARVNAQDHATLFLFAAFPQISVGLSFGSAAQALFAVVETRGDDVPLLLRAVKHLTAALRVQLAVTVLFVLAAAALAASTRIFS